MELTGDGPRGDGLQLMFDTGDVSVVRRVVVIGVAPRAPRGDPGADLIALVDPTGSVAASHLAFAWNGVHCRVTDLSGRHTTRVELTEHDVVPVHPRSSVLVPPGSLVRFGMRWVRPVRSGGDLGPLPSAG